MYGHAASAWHWVRYSLAHDMSNEWVTVTKSSKSWRKGRRGGGEGPASCRDDCCGDGTADGDAAAAAATPASAESQRSAASIEASLRQCRDTAKFSQLHSDLAAAIVNNAGWGTAAGDGHGGGEGGDSAGGSAVGDGAPPSIVCYGIGNFSFMPQAR